MKSPLVALFLVLSASVFAADRFTTVFSWGCVKTEEDAKAYAEIGVTDIFAQGEEGFAAAKRHGLRPYCSFAPYTCSRMQVLTDAEQKYLDYINAEELVKAKKPWEEISRAQAERQKAAKCQFGGEPVTALDVCPSPIKCFLSDTNCVQSFALLDRLLKTNPAAEGIAFDYIGFTNLRSCECAACQTRLQAWLKEKGLDDTAANRDRFFREGLVTYINALVDHVREVRPGIRVTLHIYPVFRPDPLYGKDLKADDIQETVAWYFSWPEAKIADYTRRILAAPHLPGSSSVPFVGLSADPESVLQLKTPAQLEAELKVILANGGTRLGVCNGADMLKPGYREVFRKYTKGAEK